LDARAGEILEGLNIPSEVHHEPLSVLSGGFKLRVLLAQVLASLPDVLLLDEPTNHLDILSIRWLETFLEDFEGCVVVVSHDHRFLDNVCTHIIDVDYERALLYTGDYSAFVAAKSGHRQRKEAEIAKQEKEIAHKKAFVERFKAKASKARQAQSRVKQIEKIVVEKLAQTSRREPHFTFKATRPSGKVALEVEGISKAYDGKPVLENVSLNILRDDRVAIIGPNGIGKSTLLKIAMGNVTADAGETEWGHEVHIGYFAQDHHELAGAEKTELHEWLWRFCPGATVGFVRGHLARVLGNLSGGEAARLIFARLAVTHPNTLVLDEPTNHLDLEGIAGLAKALCAYEGTVLFVSHDRWFVSEVATRIIEIKPTGIRDFRGSYEEYLIECADDHLDADAAVRKGRGRRRGAG
jgi:ATPase subunit of ABC transporter with duplicated ATPase domains